ncbi:MAG: single-stranded DNA-binding protein [Dehalococcoidia bacterium]|nr:single-stranded DNA-binding protein [Dehalococcoidia bacterium]
MASLNKVMIIGNLGADPEMRYTANGNAVTTFNVATNESWTDQQGERRERTEWFSVVTWNRLAETCAQYLTKGRQVYVEGRLQTRSWEGQDGQKRYRTEVIAETVRFLGGRDGGGSEGYGAGLPVGPDADGDIDPDDLPF